MGSGWKRAKGGWLGLGLKVKLGLGLRSNAKVKRPRSDTCRKVTPLRTALLLGDAG